MHIQIYIMVLNSGLLDVLGFLQKLSLEMHAPEKGSSTVILPDLLLGLL